MWSSMLDNVASGKRLPEKNMVVLGTSGMTWSAYCVAVADADAAL